MPVKFTCFHDCFSDWPFFFGQFSGTHDCSFRGAPGSSLVRDLFYHIAADLAVVIRAESYRHFGGYQMAVGKTYRHLAGGLYSGRLAAAFGRKTTAILEGSHIAVGKTHRYFQGSAIAVG